MILISALCPSRGRPESLATSVGTLLATADEPRRVEILVAADADDDVTLSAAVSLPPQVTIHVFPQRYGYDGLHHYVNSLAAAAAGRWLLLWNDDAAMLTPSWDTVVAGEEPGVLWPSTNDQDHCNVFPFWPAQWARILGHVSLSPHNDSWIQELGDALGCQRRIPVDIFHDRSDLTGGHDDETRAQSRGATREFYTPEMTLARHADAAKLRTAS